ncbi:zinc-finger protein [Linnemannia zychae]|nr:zinc-finger protein [Linnemannia zychae]
MIRNWNPAGICISDTHAQRNSGDCSQQHSAFHFLTNTPSNLLGSNNDGYSNANINYSQNNRDHSHSHPHGNHTHHGHNHSHSQGSISNGSPLSSLAGTPVSLSDPMDDSQIDHMIRCLWTGCTAEFISQEDLLPHVSQLHVPIPENDHALCLWESCETEQTDGDQLLHHLRADHQIVLPSTATIENRPLKAKPIAAKEPAIVPKPSSPSSQGGREPSSGEEQHRCGWKGCKRSFPNYDSLTTHLSEDHIGTGKGEYICEWEGCERNGRGFGQRQKAMRHIQTHTGDKPYQCSTCKKRFSEANIMAQHMRIHTGEKPFKCTEPGCGRSFSISGALTIHRRIHTGEKPFKCKFEGCNKWFAESSNLTKHLRVHTGERPSQCPFPGCEKRFSRPDQLTRHKRTHMTPAEKAAEKAAAETLAKGAVGSRAIKRSAQPSSSPASSASPELISHQEDRIDSWSSPPSPSSAAVYGDVDPAYGWHTNDDNHRKRIKA